jgi:hypothetical protein
MDNESFERGKLLYVEKTDEHLWAIWILLIAYALGIAFSFMFYTIITAIDAIVIEENFSRDFCWAPIAAFLYPQFPMFMYSIYLFFTGENSLKIYERRIGLRSSYWSRSKGADLFLPFEKIEKITLLYDGMNRKFVKEYINDLSYAGIRIITKNGKTYDVSSTLSPTDIENLIFFDYDIIHIIPRIMGSKWTKSFSLKPEITEEEWDEISKMTTNYYDSLEGFVVKQVIIMVVLFIPSIIVLFLMSLNIIEDWIILIPILIALGYIPFLNENLLKKVNKTMILTGLLIRAQEYEMLTGEKIIPPGFEIPEDYIYPQKDWPKINADFWSNAMKSLKSLSTLRDSTRSFTLKGFYHSKIENYLRYERLTKERIIPEYIRQNEELKEHLARQKGDSGKLTKKTKARLQKRNKMIKMYEALEEGRSISPDFNYKPICFKEIKSFK